MQKNEVNNGEIIESIKKSSESDFNLENERKFLSDNFTAKLNVKTKKDPSNFYDFDNNFAKFLKYAKNAQKEIRSRDKNMSFLKSKRPGTGLQSSRSTTTESSESSPGGSLCDNLPPIWDNDLYENYLRDIVDQCFDLDSFEQELQKNQEISVEQSESSSGTTTTNNEVNVSVLKKDKEVLVKFDDFQKDVIADWKPFTRKESSTGRQKTDKIFVYEPPLDNVQKQSEPGFLRRTVSIPSLTAERCPRYQKTITTRSSLVSARPKISLKPPFPVKSTRTSKLREKINSNSKTPLSMRFVGKPQSVPVDFSQLHPNLVLEDNEDNETLFPARKVKSAEILSTIADYDEKDKESLISSSVPIKKKSKVTDKEQIENESEHLRTWHNVLSENLKKSIAQLSYEKGLLEEKINQNKKPPSQSSVKSYETRRSLEVIYDYDSKIELKKFTDDMNPLENLEVTHFPIYCVRGKPKIQKIYEISINGQQQNKGDEKDENSENINNVQYYHIVHESQKKIQQQNESKEVVNEKENKMEKEIQEAQNKCDAMCQTSNKETRSHSSKRSGRTSQGRRTNKYLKPFLGKGMAVDKATSPTSHPQRPKNLRFNESSSNLSTEITLSQSSCTSPSFSEFSTQTDDEKFKILKQRRKTGKTIKKDPPSHKEEIIETAPQDTTGESLKLTELMKDILHVSTNDPSLNTTGQSLENKSHEMKNVGLDCTDLLISREIFVQTENLENFEEENDVVGEIQEIQPDEIAGQDNLTKNVPENHDLTYDILEKIKNDELQNVNTHKSRYLNRKKVKINDDLIKINNQGENQVIKDVNDDDKESRDGDKMINNEEEEKEKEPVDETKIEIPIEIVNDAIIAAIDNLPTTKDNHETIKNYDLLNHKIDDTLNNQLIEKQRQRRQQRNKIEKHTSSNIQVHSSSSSSSSRKSSTNKSFNDENLLNTNQNLMTDDGTYSKFTNNEQKQNNNLILNMQRNSNFKNINYEFYSKENDECNGAVGGMAEGQEKEKSDGGAGDSSGAAGLMFPISKTFPPKKHYDLNIQRAVKNFIESLNNTNSIDHLNQEQHHYKIQKQQNLLNKNDKRKSHQRDFNEFTIKSKSDNVNKRTGKNKTFDAGDDDTCSESITCNSNFNNGKNFNDLFSITSSSISSALAAVISTTLNDDNIVHHSSSNHKHDEKDKNANVKNSEKIKKKILPDGDDVSNKNLKVLKNFDNDVDGGAGGGNNRLSSSPSSPSLSASMKKCTLKRFCIRDDVDVDDDLQSISENLSEGEVLSIGEI